MATASKLHETKDLNNNVSSSPKPTGKILPDDTPLMKVNKLLDFIDTNLVQSSNKNNHNTNDDKDEDKDIKYAQRIRKCKTAVAEMKEILSRHVDGNLTVETDNIYPQEEQQQMDQHVASLITNIAAPTLNKEATKRSVLRKDHSGSSIALSVESTTLSKIHRDLSSKNLQKGQTCKPFDWDYDVHLLAKNTKNPLLHLVIFAMEEFDLFSSMNVNENVLAKFCRCIEKGYRPSNTYHNKIHAADVVQATTHFLIHSPNANLNELERFSLIISAAIHDYDHPGVNNSFLVNTEDPLAIAYNDRSPLENHHVAMAFIAMSDDSCKITKQFRLEDQKRFRKICISTVLATDMAKNFEIVGQFKNLIQDDPKKYIKWDDNNHVELIMQMILKLGDVSHPARKFDTHYKWSQRCVEEFYTQGDKEKESNMTPLGFMDRSKDYLPRSQVGFLQFVALPLYKPMADFCPDVVKPMIENIENNIINWKKYADASVEVPVSNDIYVSLCGEKYDPTKTYHPPFPCTDKSDGNKE